MFQFSPVCIRRCFDFFVSNLVTRKLPKVVWIEKKATTWPEKKGVGLLEEAEVLQDAEDVPLPLRGRERLEGPERLAPDASALSKLNSWRLLKLTKIKSARSRLYRSRFLQVNTRWKALAEIYTMHSFAPFSNLIFSSKIAKNILRLN